MNESPQIVVVPVPTNKQFHNLTGRIFGRLAVKSFAGDGYWNCLCECSKIVRVFRGSLTQGFTKSCGCLNSEVASSRFLRHGYSIKFQNGREQPEYSVWCKMKSRCFRHQDKSYPNYGGRGITVCERWMKFENFIADMGDRPSDKHSIERLRVNENYEPSNCVWATKREQSRNTRKTRLITLWGFTGIIADVAEHFGIHGGTLRSRFYRNLMHLYPSHPPCASAPDGA